MNPIRSISDPDLRSVGLNLKDEILSAINCAQVGTIASFDASKQTATVSLNFKRIVYNRDPAAAGGIQTEPEIRDYPVLVDVPVFVLFGGAARLTMPVAAGDTCLLLFNDRDLDVWFATGVTAPPNSARMHSLSDAIALVGVRSLANLISSYATNAAELFYLTSKLRVAAGGGSAVVDADVTMTSANGGVVAAKTKIDVHNASGSLKSALDALMTALTGWVDTNGDSPNSGTIAALNAVRTSIDNLLQ